MLHRLQVLYIQLGLYSCSVSTYITYLEAALVLKYKSRSFAHGKACNFDSGENHLESRLGQSLQCKGFRVLPSV
jgi:hypothetical protein